MSFECERITRNVFEVDYNRCRNNWCSDLKDLLNLLELKYYFESKITIDINLVQLKIHYFYSNIWGCEILDIPKLRTDNSFKTSFGRENYVAMDMCKYLRSILAQFRCGILPLRIETGGYHGEPVEDRLCKLK